jgi:hypothetical protein
MKLYASFIYVRPEKKENKLNWTYVIINQQNAIKKWKNETKSDYVQMAFCI